MRILLSALLVTFLALAAHAQTVVGTFGVSTTGYVSTSQLITQNVSLTTGATTWGYISSTGTYLPKLATDNLSTTTISTSSLTTANLTVTGTPTASTDAATKAYVDSVAAAAGGGGTVACSNLGSSACTLSRIGGAIFTGKAPRTFAVSSDGTKMAVAFTSADYIYTSTDSGATWTARTNAGQKSFLKVTISDNGNILYAIRNASYGTADAGIIKSTDGGATWTQLTGYGSTTYQITNMDVTPDGQSLIVYATSGSSNYYVVYSANGGSTWTTTNVNNNSWTGYVAISPNGMNMLYTYYNGSSYNLYKITNRGTPAIYQLSGNSNSPSNLEIFDDGGTIYSHYNGSNYYVLRTYGNGNQRQIFTPTPSNYPVNTVAASSNGLRIFLGINVAANGNQMSTDGGDIFNSTTFMKGIDPSNIGYGPADIYFDTSGKMYFIRSQFETSIYVANCP